MLGLLSSLVHSVVKNIHNQFLTAQPTRPRRAWSRAIYLAVLLCGAAGFAQSAKAETVLWSQDFETDTSGLFFSLDILGNVSHENGQLIVDTEDGFSGWDQYITSEQFYAFGDTLVYKAEITPLDSGDGVGSIGIGIRSEFTEYSHYAMFTSGQLWVEYSTPGCGGGCFAAEELGSFDYNTTYQLEVDVTPTGTTLYVYELGTSREQGYSHTFNATGWENTGFWVYSYSSWYGPIEKLAIDNMQIISQTTPTVLTITQPQNNAFLNTNPPSFGLSYSSPVTIDTNTLQLSENGTPLGASCDADDTSALCVLTAALTEGSHTVSADVSDTQSNPLPTAEITFTIDTIAPVVTITSPDEGLITNQSAQTVAGSLSEPVDTLTLNQNSSVSSIQADGNNDFSQAVTLQEGGTQLTVTALDFANNLGSASRNVSLDTQVPPLPDIVLITIGEPGNGQVTVAGEAGSVEANSQVTVTNTRTSQSVTVTAAADGSFNLQVVAEVGDELTITVSDAAGNNSDTTTVSVQANLPPDPATVAPALNPNQFTPLIDATSFLYTGSNPIQTGVVSGTIEERRVAVVRGHVLTRDNNPLPGVTVTVKDHPEFGQTLSRADGMFDLVVNGGGVLILNYAKEDYLPVQRQVNTPWQDYIFADDIVMIQLDPQVTTIDLTSPVMQVAQGSLQTDADGTRQATILFPVGTTATMTLPDGTQQALTTLNVRATEYTVGENGPNAMPGELPPTSGYTYAVELSVDEVIAAGVKRNGIDLVFNQPVSFYVNNFLEFPTGENVPVGYYDGDNAAWIPYNDGRIVEILSIENNLAVLDVDGSGNPATQTQLDELGITTAELQQLASLYQTGQSLWRTRLMHLSTWDCNWGVAVSSEAGRLDVAAAQTANKNNADVECNKRGCTIGAQSQTLGEEIPISGTAYGLHYSSHRAPGRKSKNTVNIPLSGASIPGSLQSIEVDIEVAGRRIKDSIYPQPDLTYTFEWDGLDGFGREVYGSVAASIKVSYRYPCIYLSAWNSGGGGGGGSAPSFAAFSAAFELIGTRNNCQAFAFPSLTQVTLESPLDPPVNVIGNWSVDVHHFWDGRSQLLKGDGRQRNLFLSTVDTVAGNGTTSAHIEGGLATEGGIGHMEDVATDAAGNFYIPDMDRNRVFRISPEGIITTFAGQSGGTGFSGDGGPATQAQLNKPTSVTLDAAGNLYIADSGNVRIRKVDTNGIITTVAGSGLRGDSGDGGPAIEARFGTTSAQVPPLAVAADSNGNLYIADFGRNRIRRVGPDGIITAYAGSGAFGFSGDDGPALQALFSYPADIEVDTSGNLYVTDYMNRRVRCISPDGIIMTVAGGGTSQSDGISATDALLGDLEGITVDANGNLYFIDMTHYTIRRVSLDGIITTVGGVGTSGFSGDKGPATQAQFGHVLYGIDVDMLSNLYIADAANLRIRKISNVNGIAGQVASEDSLQQFIFDASGRHLRTLNTLTGETEYEFGRDSEGQLITITDVDGDITTIERDTNGVATAVISADGQRTELTVDTNGHLTGVTNPANESYQMTYMVNGLMTEFRDRKNQLNTYGYDALGRLTSDVNAGGGGWTLSREEVGDGYRTSLTTAEGRVQSFTVEPQSNGDLLQVNAGADGTVNQMLSRSNQVDTSTYVDGTTVTVSEGPDPRFNMQAPIVKNGIIHTPSGLTSITTIVRNATLTDIADPLSLQTLDETTTINGRAFHTGYDAASLTFTSTSAQGRTATQTINAQGRPVTSQINGLAPVSFAYDARGRLETITEGGGAEQRQTTLNYHAIGLQAGYLQSIIDAENRTISFEYDGAGRVTQQTLPDNRQISYGYDANGNVTSITPPGRPAHVFNYNAFDLEGQYTPPTVSGITTPQTVYDYNLDKELIRITRPDAQQINFNYNSGAQLTSMVLPTGSYSYTYLPTSGQLDTITSPDNIVLDYSYDGFLLTGQTWTGAIAGSVTQTYNNNFFITQRCVNANCINAGYDNDGLLTSAGSLILTRDPQRAGLITDTTLGNVTTGQDYNDFGELETVDADYQTTDLYDVTYTRDDLGRITQKTETVQAAAVTDVYTYDLAGRLDTVTRNGQLIDYDYDSNGNRLSRTEGANVESGVYDDQDRLTSYAGCSYTYTDNGELETKTCGTDVTTYNYDVLGNLLSVELPNGDDIGYVIDGENRRVGRWVNGVITHGWLYKDQLNPIAELNADGSIRSHFVYADKINVPSYMIRDGVTYRIISDHLGSPRLVIDASSGTVVQRVDYDEFGRVIADSNPGFQPFGFAGGIYDTNTGLVRFGARDYSTEVGRWLSKDPIKFDGGLNLYGYTFNDPINFRDDNGQFVFVLPAVAVGAIIGGAIGAVNAAIISRGSWGAIGVGALTGAVTGAATATFPLVAIASATSQGAMVATALGAAAFGAAVGAVGEIANQRINGGCFNGLAVGAAALGGAIGGLAGGFGTVAGLGKAAAAAVGAAFGGTGSTGYALGMAAAFGGMF